MDLEKYGIFNEELMICISRREYGI